MGQHYLDCLFSPRAIAVFGASQRHESVGYRVFTNLLESDYSGSVYAINPKYEKLGEQRCYPDIHSIGQPINLAVIATPAATVPSIIRDCGEHGVRAAIVHSAGFGDDNTHGRNLKQEMLENARQYHIRLLGPNCLGLIQPAIGINATFSKNNARPGKLALVSQSGALCTAVLDWATLHDIGFSGIVSLGDAADIDFGDILDYLSQDAQTHSILMYIEGIRDARGFMSGLRSAARMKPVIVIKSGRHSEGARAAITHTGAMVGADNVFDAALQRAGVVRAMTVSQLFAAAQVMSSEYRVNGNRLAIITNGGGPGVMATDRATDLGIELAELSEETVQVLDKTLPAHWSFANPIDVLGDADAERYYHAVRACLDDHGVDGIIVMLTPQAMTQPLDCAQAVLKARGKTSKPVLVCWMGEEQVRVSNEFFAKHHIPAFTSPESAVEAFFYLASYYRNQQLLMQVPTPLGRHSEPDIDGAGLIIENALQDGRKILTTAESKAVLHAFSIPVTQSIECHDPGEALVVAESIGFPVVMKIHSPDITHKTDVSGVRLNIGDAQTVRSAFHELVNIVSNKSRGAEIRGVTIEPMYHSSHGRELIIGVIRDPVFGPAITFGAGGTQVEVLHDQAIALPPLNSYLARKMIEQTRVARLLKAYRNLPEVNMESLVQLLRRVSEMVCELPHIESLDINPLIADEQGVIALDARIEVKRPIPSWDRYNHMAIHPYPKHLISRMQLADGTYITIRPIRPEDATIEQSFVKKLSNQSKYFRFMRSLNELTPDMLVRFTQLDYSREMALIAVLDEATGEIELGVARYVTNPDGKSCEFALVVADEWQGRGIGTHLMTALMDIARRRGLSVMEGEVLANNHNMLKLITNLGFDIRTSHEDAGIKSVSRDL